jgi:hypothetical protein
MSRMGLFFCSTLVLCFAAVPAGARRTSSQQTATPPAQTASPTPRTATSPAQTVTPVPQTTNPPTPNGAIPCDPLISPSAGTATTPPPTANTTTTTNPTANTTTSTDTQPSSASNSPGGAGTTQATSPTTSTGVHPRAGRTRRQTTRRLVLRQPVQAEPPQQAVRPENPALVLALRLPRHRNLSEAGSPNSRR